jgi:hypothetical protein
MNDPATRVAADTDALRSAAQRLHDIAADPACAAMIPLALEAVEDALTTLSRASYAAAHALIPPGSSGDSIAARYARAATTWPSPRAGGPSHEQQARVLSSLHDAGAALRAAGAHCGRAAQNLAATMEPPRNANARQSLDPHAACAAPSSVAIEPWTTSRTR